MINKTIILTSVIITTLLGTLGVGNPGFAEVNNGIVSTDLNELTSSETIDSAINPDGSWYEFAFITRDGNTVVSGCAPNDPAGPTCDPSNETPTQFAPAPPWTFTCSGTCIITVTDAFASGDQFEIFDRGISLGTTSLPTPNPTGCGSDPVICITDTNFSSGMFVLGAGSHSLTIELIINQFGAGAAYFKIEELFVDPVMVELDIKPGSFPNSININNMGVVPVSILGSDSFDVTAVDALTLEFGPGDSSPTHYAYEDVNEDGFEDLISHYIQKETGITCEDAGAIITGQLTDGGTIIGYDSVNVVSCN